MPGVDHPILRVSAGFSFCSVFFFFRSVVLLRFFLSFICFLLGYYAPADSFVKGPKVGQEGQASVT